VRGDARITPDTQREFAGKVGAKYGVDLADFDAPGDDRVVVTIDAARVNAVDMTAG